VGVTLQKLLPLAKAVYPLLEDEASRREIVSYLTQMPIQSKDKHPLDVARFWAAYGTVYDDEEFSADNEKLGNFLVGLGEVLLKTPAK
jgi:hypothetical protein